MHEHHRAFKLINAGLLALAGLLLTLFFVALAFELVALKQFFGLQNFHALVAGLLLVYGALVQPQLSQRSAAAASLVSLILAAALIGSLVVTTGGFLSFYYLFWLGLILLSGAFGMAVTSGLVATSGLYFLFSVVVQTSNINLHTNLSQLVAALAAGGFSYWLWRHRQLSSETTSHVSNLSRQLNAEQLKSELMLRSIGDGAAVIDASGKIQFFNPAAAKITGWQESEAVGLDYKAVVSLLNEQFQPLEGSEHPFEQAVQRRESVRRSDILVKTRSGKKIALYLTVSPIIADDEVTGIIVVFRDITAEKTVQRQRDEFISTASHEMRTPLASIEGYLALALNEKVSKIDANAKGYLLKAHETVEHLGRLFRDLLSVTKLEEGKMPSRPEVVEIGKLVRAVIDELEPIAHNKGLQLEVKSEPTPGQKHLEPLYYVHVDPERIREVLVNLVDNAIKFTAHGSIAITIKGTDSFVTVGVHDHGIGIAPEDIPHLFQKFYRVESSDVRTSGGTGLGLYLSRSLIELYGGRIWVESKLGEGSHFYFTLPRLEYAQAQQLQTKQADPLNQPRHAQRQPARANSGVDKTPPAA